MKACDDCPHWLGCRFRKECHVSDYHDCCDYWHFEEMREDARYDNNVYDKEYDDDTEDDEE